MHKYAEVLKQRRKEAGLTQAEFAAKLEMRRDNYARLEKGELDIKLSLIEKICTKLDIHPAEIIETRPEPTLGDKAK